MKHHVDGQLVKGEIMNIKLKLIKFFDWVDAKIIGHRIYWLCNLIGNSSWWGEEVEVYFTDQEFLNLAIEAHKRDITFNDLCIKIIEEYIQNNS